MPGKDDRIAYPTNILKRPNHRTRIEMSDNAPKTGFSAAPLNPFIASLLGLLQVINNWSLTGDLNKKSARLNRCCSFFCSNLSKTQERRNLS